MQVALMTGLTGYTRRYEYNKRMRIWETCTILAEKEFKKLQDQADFNKRVDPLIYVGRLLCSIFTGSIAVAFITVVVMTNLDKLGKETDKLNPIDQMTEVLHDGEDTTLDLLMTILLAHLFIFFSFFFIMTTQHGNSTVGERFATPTFNAMDEGETLLSSWLLNGALHNVICTGVKQYAVMMFDGWTRGTISYETAVLTNHTSLFFTIANVSIFDYVFLLSAITTVIIIACNGSGRIRYNDILDEKGTY